MGHCKGKQLFLLFYVGEENIFAYHAFLPCESPLLFTENTAFWSPKGPSTLSNSLQHQLGLLQFNTGLTLSKTESVKPHRLRTHSHKIIPHYVGN